MDKFNCIICYILNSILKLVSVAEQTCLSLTWSTDLLTLRCIYAAVQYGALRVELKMHTLHVYAKVKNMDTVNVLKFEQILTFCSQLKCWFSGLKFRKCLSEY